MKYGSEMAFNQTDIACQPTCHPEFQHCHPEFISGSAQSVKCKQTLKQAQGDRTLSCNDTISVQHDNVERLLAAKRPLLASTSPTRPLSLFVRAFTLAEILIVLVILGIVAVLVIPGLIQNVEKKATVSKLQKVYSNMHQVVVRSELDNGMSSGWRLTVVPAEIEEDFNKYWAPYLRIAKICSSAADCGYRVGAWKYLNRVLGEGVTIVIPESRNTFVMPDGVVVIVMGYTTYETGPVATRTLYCDLNGPKGPNTIGKDVFMFTIYNNGGMQMYGFDAPDATVNTDCSLPNGNGRYCGTKILRDGWQIKDKGPNAYPW